MKVAAITITYNRLELTKKTVESFNEKTKVDFHLFIDNGSTDGTIEYLLSKNHILLTKNHGIAYAFREAVRALEGYDYILKLDNDIETVTPDIIDAMLGFYKLNGNNFVVSPVDLNLDPNYKPASLGRKELKGFDCNFVTHTGGAFQLIPISICQKLCNDWNHLKAGDYSIGRYYRRHGFRPVYLERLQMRHIGLNQTSPNYIL